jgi:hypothetical protein
MTSAAACASHIICSAQVGATSTVASNLERRLHVIEEHSRREEKRSHKKTKRKIAQEQAKTKAKNKQTSSARYYLTYLKLKTISKLS